MFRLVDRSRVVNIDVEGCIQYCHNLNFTKNVCHRSLVCKKLLITHLGFTSRCLIIIPERSAEREVIRVGLCHAGLLVGGLHVRLLVLLVGLDQLIVQVPVVPAQRRQVVARVHRTLSRKIDRLPHSSKIN